MFKTAITRSAADRLEMQCNALRQSQTRTKTNGEAINVKSSHIFSKPSVLIIVFAIGAYVGKKSASPREQQIELEKIDKAVVITENTKRPSYMLSLIGTVISAASLYLRVLRSSDDGEETTDLEPEINSVEVH